MKKFSLSVILALLTVSIQQTYAIASSCSCTPEIRAFKGEPSELLPDTCYLYEIAEDCRARMIDFCDKDGAPVNWDPSSEALPGPWIPASEVCFLAPELCSIQCPREAPRYPWSSNK